MTMNDRYLPASLGNQTSPRWKAWKEHHPLSLPAALTLVLAACAGSQGPAIARPGDEGYLDPGPPVGALGPKYAGKVVFAKTPVAVTSGDDSSVTNRVTLGETFFGRFYSKNSPHNLMPGCDKPRLVVRYRLNDEPLKPGSQLAGLSPLASMMFKDPNHQVAESLTGDAEVAMTAPFDEKRDKTTTQKKFQHEVVPRLHEGSNKMAVVITVDCHSSAAEDPVIAEGVLTIDVPPGGVSA